jgi:hypothetical protein
VPPGARHTSRPPTRHRLSRSRAPGQALIRRSGLIRRGLGRGASPDEGVRGSTKFRRYNEPTEADGV